MRPSYSHTFGPLTEVDGFLDLFLGNHNEADELLINNGLANFSSSPSFPGSTAATHAAAFGDVDGGLKVMLKLLTSR